MNRFIIKGLYRDKSRSLLPVVVTAAGVFIVFLGLCFLNGMLENMIECNANFDTGHIKIVSKAYAQDISIRPIELYMDTDHENLIKSLDKYFSDYTWTSRINFGGIIDIPDKSGNTFTQAVTGAMAIDFLSPGSRWHEKLNIKKALKKGNLIKAPRDILISKKLAKELKVELNQTATLMTNTCEGATCSANYKIVGFVEFGISTMDKGMILMDLSDAQNLLDMQDVEVELLGFANTGYNRESVISRATIFNNSNDYKKNKYAPFALTLEDQNNLKELLGMTGKVNFIAVIVFIFLMTLVLWNAGLISGLRRYAEIGIRLAIGEKRSHIIGSLLIESLLTGLAGTTIGIILALPLVYYLQEYGIDYSEQMKNISMMVNSVMKAKITVKSMIISMIPGIFSSFLGMAIASLGILKRETASLFKELE